MNSGTGSQLPARKSAEVSARYPIGRSSYESTHKCQRGSWLSRKISRHADQPLELKGPGAGPQIGAANATLSDAMAEELGILPNDRVCVLVCVEGTHDDAGLRGLSRALHRDEGSLSGLSVDDRFAFVPLGGGTLQHWATGRYMQGLGRPELHLYYNDVARYRRVADQVIARSNGSSARLTDRRELENHLHPDVIKEILGVGVDFGERDDVPAIISSAVAADRTRPPLDPRTVGSKLAEQPDAKMAADRVKDIGAAEEIRS